MFIVSRGDGMYLVEYVAETIESLGFKEWSNNWMNAASYESEEHAEHVAGLVNGSVVYVD